MPRWLDGLERTVFPQGDFHEIDLERVRLSNRGVRGINLKPGKVGSRGTSSTLTRPLPVKHAMMASSGATALEDLLAGTANGGFVVNDDGRIIFWTRANGGGRTVRLNLRRGGVSAS